ncbi:MAG: hypothetical protein CVU39_04965 [Chloroflexi bacterium HGW-Chloroflexi-10]|nr:MAG: hypothetical protein CVU39_04965 [Chloroflexi bacterium HGW-Chloroflexi-10]
MAGRPRFSVGIITLWKTTLHQRIINEETMNKTWLVFRNELFTTVKRKSFIITLFLIPIIGGIVTLVVGNSQKQSSAFGAIGEYLVPKSVSEKHAIVDLSGLIKTIPSEYQDTFSTYKELVDAENALSLGSIASIYIIEPEYIQEGSITLVSEDYNPLGSGDQNNMIERIIQSNLLANQPQILERIQVPMDLEIKILSPEPQRDPESSLTFFLPYIVTILFYMIILSSSSLMLNSISNEKSNRVIEILMTSVTPMQLLTGKIIALGLVGLLQTIIWSGSGFLILQFSGQSFDISSSFQLPPSILIWGLIFFLCGYALYASLMAGLGALVPNLREASQATTLVVMPLIIPMVLLGVIIEDPNGVVAMIFSLFPLTAPVTMMTRLAATTVPLWQILTAIVLSLITSYLVIRSVSSFFHARHLLSGEEFKSKRFLAALFGKL